MGCYKMMHSFSGNHKKSKIFLGLFLQLFFTLQLAYTAETYSIGVLSLRGDINNETKWEPTAKYLNQKLSPIKFSIKPLEYCEVESAISTRSVDFFIVNPALYINLEYQYGASRIATLKNKGVNGEDQLFYSTVIFTTTDNNKINSLEDVESKKVGAVHRESLGGWIIAQRELLRHGVDAKKELLKLYFFSTHDRVVKEVLSKKVDVGIVRTEILEKMAKENKIDLTKIKVLNSQQHKGFNYLHSSELYPEWVLAKTEATEQKISDMVLSELLKLKATDEASLASETNGWSTPQMYEPVRECLRILSLKPYEKTDMTLYELLDRYRYQTLALLAMFITVLLLALYIARTNRKLNATKLNLESEIEHRKETQDQLILRQNELDVLTNYLEQKVVEKSNALVRAEQEKVSSYKELVNMLVSLIEKRDTYTAGHSRRVAFYCNLIALEMGVDTVSIDRLVNAAILHDIGKISTPDSILLKPDKLTKLEYDIIKTHVTVGAEMIESIKGYESFSSILKNHHEKFDGSGYPEHKKGDEIPLLSHIMIVADAFDAMTTNRIYKTKKSKNDALDELTRFGGTMYHPDVVTAAVKALKGVVIEDSITQIPVTTIEKERFSYFFKDSLTGLNNERYYSLICQGDNHPKHFVQKTNITLGHFTKYNAIYGWDAGNELLKAIAAYLQNSFEQATIFRIHGDDFALMFEECVDVSSEAKDYCASLGNGVIKVSVFTLISQF